MAATATSLGSRMDAPKLKTDVGFMKLITTDDEWQREVLDAGPILLVIIDIFSPMWGPCEMASGHFSNLFFDEGDNIGMKFIRADSSKITALTTLKDECMPCFQFVLNGETVAEIKGADIAKIVETIKTKAPSLKDAPNWA